MSEAFGIPRLCDAGSRLTGPVVGWSVPCLEKGKNRLQLQGRINKAVQLCDEHMGTISGATAYHPPAVAE